MIDREEIRRRIKMAVEKRHGRPLGPAPRYDEVYFEGVRWLDSLARGDSMPDNMTDEEIAKALDHSQPLKVDLVATAKAGRLERIATPIWAAMVSHSYYAQDQATKAELAAVAVSLAEALMAELDRRK